MFNKCIIYVNLASILVVLVSAGVIPEVEDFGPILRPDNPTGARDILGYDNFQTIRNAKQQVKYGNNWEQYDTAPIQDVQYNHARNLEGTRNSEDSNLFHQRRY